MQENIGKAYNAQEWEDALYAAWEKSGAFKPDTPLASGQSRRDETFSIVLPPPNVTGRLHVGHAAMLAIEDAFVRFKRMQGYRTLWLPGTDHAAIATQSKVEKLIQEEEGKTRHDFSREAFLARVDAFAKDSHDTIVHQTKKMGSSLDWSREAFTLDDARSKAVREAFARMYADELIYQGDRIVNWDPKLQTTVSDDEIEWKEETTPFYYLQYGPFVIGTARPETKFGDKYVVMHPDDTRYKDYTDGQTIELEWINGPITATIIKDESIDPNFGTGVMTITPWHDHTDFDIAERHHLDKEQIIDEHGKLLPIAGPEFSGLSITEARKKIIDRLNKKGLVVKIDERYVHNIAVNSRGGGLIEPQIKKQWFVDVHREFVRNGKKVTLKNLMREAVSSSAVTILPERFEKTYYHWINNLRDWCISRQIWYGHRIPVWYCLSCGKKRVNPEVKSRWHFVRHGETDWNKQNILQGASDIPLNETGRAQAKTAGEQLKGAGIDIIFSSHLKRARETADIIARELGISEIIEDERFQERNMGEAEGLPVAELHTRYPDFQKYHGKASGGESYAETEERFFEAVSEHFAKHAHKNVVIVSHGAALRAFLRRIKNIDPTQFTEMKRVPNATPFSVDILEPCSCGNHFFEQDPDTLDTWFSSGLWTFSTLGWGSDTEQWNREKIYHPTSLLETGYDILFFWVARMILMSTYLLDEVPFKTVYLHGLVRDEQGRKMSKSLGNILDPLDVIEQYGADALRLSLVIGSTPGNDIKIGDAKIVSYRNFTNKLWNIGRYVAGTEGTILPSEAPLPKSAADHWILSRLSSVSREVTDLLTDYQLSLAGEKLRDFTWNEFADWYVEIHKVEKDDAVLRFVFGTILKLWHPIMPFVTEALWKTFGHQTLLALESWPETSYQTDKKMGSSFNDLISLVESIRSVRALYHIDPAKTLSLAVSDSSRLIIENEALMKRLARLDTIRSVESAPHHSALVQSGTLQAFIELEGVIDFAAERARLEKEISNKKNFQSSLEKRLADENFVKRAPEHILAQSKETLDQTTNEIKHLEAALAGLL